MVYHLQQVVDRAKKDEIVGTVTHSPLNPKEQFQVRQVDRSHQEVPQPLLERQHDLG